MTYDVTARISDSEAADRIALALAATEEVEQVHMAPTEHRLWCVLCERQFRTRLGHWLHQVGLGPLP